MDAPAGRTTHARNKPFAPIAGLVLGVLLAGLAAGSTLALSPVGLKRQITALVIGVGSAWFITTKRPSVALALLMLYLGLLDGYLKLSTGSGLVTLGRDVLLYAIVLGILVRSHVQGRRIPLPPLSGWVLAYTVIVLVQLANPNGGTLFHSLAGVRSHLEFVPLFFLAYLTVRSVANLRRFVLLLLLIGAVNGLVGYVQFNLSPGQLAGWGPGYAQRINGTGAFSASGRVFSDTSGTARVRPFGLGSDAGAGGLFGVLALGGVFALVSPGMPLGHRLIAALCGVGVVSGIATSQGRAVVVAAVATALAYGVLTATSQRRTASLAGLAVAAGLSYFVVTSIVSSAGADAFRYQGISASKILATASSVNGRPGQFQAVTFAVTHYPLGAGLATAGPATGTRGGSALTGKLNAESEFSFLVLEGGIPALVVVLGLSVLLLTLGLSRCRREPDPRTRALLAAVICPIAGILVSFYAGPGTVTVPEGPFLWCVGGVIAYWLITRPTERALAGSAPA